MGRIFESEFETGDFSEWDSSTAHITVTNTVSTHHGSYAMRSVNNGAGWGERCTSTITVGNNYYMRAYIRFETLPDTNQNIGVGPRFASTGGAMAYVTMNPSTRDKWGVTIVSNSTQWQSTTETIETGRWYCVELHYYANGASSVAQLWIDGTLVVDYTGAGHSYNINEATENVYTSADPGSEIIILHDCIVVSTTYIGPHEMLTSGYETNDFSEWTTTVATSGEAVTISTDVVKSGTYSAKFTTNGGGGYENAYARYDLTDNYNTLHTRNYVNVNASGIGANYEYISLIRYRRDTTLLAHFGVKQNYSGSIVFWSQVRDGTSYINLYSTIPLVKDTWYCIESKWVYGATNGGVEFIVDGSTVISSLTRDTDNYGYPNQLICGIAEGNNLSPSTVYTDCHVISDNYIGTLQTALSTVTKAFASFYTKRVNITSNIISKFLSKTKLTDTLSLKYNIKNLLTKRLVMAKSFKFDFGTNDSPVADGYIGVSGATVYSSSLGYGWGTDISDGDRDRTLPSDLLRDFCQTSTPQTFRVDVPNGNYSIIATNGDYSYAHDNYIITINGTPKATISTSANQFIESTFPIEVTDGKIEVVMSDPGGGDPNWVLNALEIKSNSGAFLIRNNLVDAITNLYNDRINIFKELTNSSNADMLMWWKLDEVGYDVDPVDSSTNGYNGTLGTQIYNISLCQSTVNWTADNGVVSLNSQDRYDGIYCINASLTPTIAGGTVSLTYNLGTLNVSDGYHAIEHWLQCDKPNGSFTTARVYLYDIYGNYRYKDIEFNANEWNSQENYIAYLEFYGNKDDSTGGSASTICPCENTIGWTTDNDNLPTIEYSNKEGNYQIRHYISTNKMTINTEYYLRYSTVGVWDWSSNSHLVMNLGVCTPNSEFNYFRVKITDTDGNYGYWNAYNYGLNYANLRGMYFPLGTYTADSGTIPNLASINAIDFVWNRGTLSRDQYTAIDWIRTDDIDTNKLVNIKWEFTCPTTDPFNLKIGKIRAGTHPKPVDGTRLFKRNQLRATSSNPHIDGSSYSISLRVKFNDLTQLNTSHATALFFKSRCNINMSTTGITYLTYHIAAPETSKSVNANVTWETDKWYYIVAICTNESVPDAADGTMKIFVYDENGLVSSNIATGFRTQVNSDTTYIEINRPYWMCYQNDYLDAYYDDIRIYNKALSDDEVYQLWRNKKYNIKQNVINPLSFFNGIKNNLSKNLGELYNLYNKVSKTLNTHSKIIQAITKRMYIGITDVPILFNSSFETGDFSEWTSTSGTPPEVTNEIANSGNYSAKLNAYEYINRYFTQSSEIYARFYINFAEHLPNSSTDRIFIIRNNNNSLQNISLYRDADGVYSLINYYESSSSICQYIWNEFELNKWYCITLHYKKGTGNNGISELFIDNQLVASNYTTTSTTEPNNAYIIHDTISGGHTFYVDDVGISNTFIGLLPYGYNLKAKITDTLTSKYLLKNLLTKQSRFLYNIKAKVSKGYSLSYDIFANISKSLSFFNLLKAKLTEPVRGLYGNKANLLNNLILRQSIRNNFTKTLTFISKTIQKVTKPFRGIYLLRANMLKNLSFYQLIKANVSKSLSMFWGLRQLLTEPVRGLYNNKQNIINTLTNRYSVYFNLHKTITSIYLLKAKIRNSFTSIYNNKETLLKTVRFFNNIKTNLSNSVTTLCNIIGKVQLDLSLINKYNIKSNILTSFRLTYPIKINLAKAISSLYLLKSKLAKIITSKYLLKQIITKTFNSLNLLKENISNGLTITYTNLANIIKVYSANYNLKSNLTKSISQIYLIKANLTKILSSINIIYSKLTTQLGGIWKLRANISNNISQLYLLRQNISSVLTTLYLLKANVSKQLTTSHNILSSVSKTLRSYSVLMSSVSIHISSINIIRSVVSRSISLRFEYQTLLYEIVGILDRFTLEYLDRMENINVADKSAMRFIIKRTENIHEALRTIQDTLKRPIKKSS